MTDPTPSSYLRGKSSARVRVPLPGHLLSRLNSYGLAASAAGVALLACSNSAEAAPVCGSLAVTPQHRHLCFQSRVPEASAVQRGPHLQRTFIAYTKPAGTRVLHRQYTGCASNGQRERVTHRTGFGGLDWARRKFWQGQAIRSIIRLLLPQSIQRKLPAQSGRIRRLSVYSSGTAPLRLAAREARKTEWCKIRRSRAPALRIRLRIVT